VRGIGSGEALATGHSAQGYTHYLLGDLIAARQHLLRAIEYRPRTFLGTARPGGDSLVFAGQNEWHLGYADRGLRYMEEALLQARAANNPFGVGFAVLFSGLLHGLRRDYTRAREANDEALRFGAASGFPLLNALAKIFDAWVRAKMGEANDAVDRIREGIELNRMKFYVTRPKYLGYLCETQALGAVDDALITVEQSLTANPDELIYRPEMLRLRGELRLEKGQDEPSEADFRASIALDTVHSCQEGFAD
jgi:tetratricopeptide (TPR) repeat protein